MSSLSIDLSLSEWVLFIVAGVFTGVINTLAGSGSLITLPIFIFIGGLPAPIANGTNRIGALFQSMLGVTAFARQGHLPKQGLPWLVIPAILGAVLGSWLATGLDKSQMNSAIGILMVFMLIVLLVNPKRWIQPSTPDPKRLRNPLTLLVFFGIGLYGGFIQAGVGIFLLAGLVLAARFELKFANPVKLLIVLCFNIPALYIFWINDQVHLGLGLAMALFQGIGTLLGVYVVAKVPNANVWIHRLLIAIVVVSAGKFLGVYAWVGQFF